MHDAAVSLGGALGHALLQPQPHSGSTCGSSTCGGGMPSTRRGLQPPARGPPAARGTQSQPRAPSGTVRAGTREAAAATPVPGRCQRPPAGRRGQQSVPACVSRSTCLWCCFAHRMHGAALVLTPRAGGQLASCHAMVARQPMVAHHMAMPPAVVQSTRQNFKHHGGSAQAQQRPWLPPALTSMASSTPGTTLEGGTAS